MSRKNQVLEGKSIHRVEPIRLPKNTIVAKLLKKKPITRLGETGNFIVDYDSVGGLVLLYGKEAPTSHGFKLGLNKNEVTDVINLLKQAKALFIV